MKKGSFLFKILIFLALFVFSVNTAVSYFATVKIEKLSKSSSEIDITFADASYRLWNNSFEFKKFKISKNSLFSVTTNSIKLKNINWFSLCFYNELSLSTVEISSPKLNKYSSSVKQASAKASKNIPLITIDKLLVTNGSLKDFNQKGFQVDKADIDVRFFKYNYLKNQNKLPFTYKTISGTIINVKKCYTDFDCLKVEQIVVNNNTVEILNSSIKTKYTKSQFSQKILTERDHLNLSFPKITFRGFDLSVKQTQLQLSSESVNIIAPKLIFYRDKNLPDSKKYKPIYGEIFHGLSEVLELTLPEINVSDGLVSYEVLTERDAETGTIEFNDINAKLAINNAKVDSFIKFESTAKFMNKSPINLSINFEDLSTNTFKVEGTIKDFKTAYVNTFLYHVLNTQLEGEMQQTYFTITGNNEIARGQIKMKYDNLKLKFLKKDLFKVNKLASALGNLLINNGSKTDAEGYRNGSIEFERNQTKSFFSYLWFSLRHGILDTLTGKPTL